MIDVPRLCPVVQADFHSGEMSLPPAYPSIGNYTLTLLAYGFGFHRPARSKED